MKTRKGPKISADNEGDSKPNKLDNQDLKQPETENNKVLTQDENKAGLSVQSQDIRSAEAINVTPIRTSQRLKRKSEERSKIQNSVTDSEKEKQQNGKSKKRFKSASTETNAKEFQPKTSAVKSSTAGNEPETSTRNDVKFEEQNENLLNENGQNKEYLNFMKEQIQSFNLLSREKNIGTSVQDKRGENTEISGETERSDHTYQLMMKGEKVKNDSKIHEQDAIFVSESQPDVKPGLKSVADEGVGITTAIRSDHKEGTSAHIGIDSKSTDTKHVPDIESKPQKCYSLLKNVDFGTHFTSVGSPTTKSASNSLPVDSTLEEVGVPCIDNSFYTSDMVQSEINDDMIFGSVSAVVKPACKTFIETVRTTGVRVLNKHTDCTVLQGSLKSVMRAKAILKEQLDAINNHNQEMSTEDTGNVNTITKDNEVVHVEIPVNEVIVTNDNEHKQSITSLSTSINENPHTFGGEDKGTVGEIGMNKSNGSSDKLAVTHNDSGNQNLPMQKVFKTQYFCEKCDGKFWNPDALKLHIDRKHSPIICHLCGKGFAFKRYLYMHMKRHNNVRKFECEVCGWKFMERNKLMLHLESHKSTSERKLPYRCEYCNKQFYNKAGWSDHMNTHTGTRPFQCDKCEATFAHRIGLKRHEVVHTKNKPFVCLHCNKAFPFKSKLDAHLTIHTGGSKYSCGLCGKVYTVSSSVKRHMETCQVKNAMTVKDEELDQNTIDIINATVTDPEAVYMCGICGSLFNSLEKASSHTATHEPTNSEAQPDQLADTAAYHEIVSGQIDPLETQTSCQVIEMTDLTNL